MSEAMRPWYREFWAWFVFAPPLASVVLGLSLVTIAVQNRDAMVVDDYARIGRTFEMQTARDEAARQLGVSARLHWDAEGRSISVYVPGLVDAPRTMRLDLIHPTQVEADRSLVLKPDATGVYRAGSGEVGAGRRYVRLVPEEGAWRLAGEWGGERADIVLEAGGG